MLRDGGLGRHGGCTATHDEPVTDRLANGGHDGWGAEVHGDRSVDFLTQEGIACDVALRDGRFDDCEVRMTGFKTSQERGGDVFPEQKAVEVDVQLEVRRHRLTDGFELLFDVEPRAGFGLHRGKAHRLGRFCLSCPLFGFHVLRPPGYGAGITVLVAEQPMARQVCQLARKVVESHLNANPETVVAQQIEDVVPDRLAEPIVCRTGRAVEGKVFADTFDAGRGPYAEQVDDAEVGDADVLYFAASGVKGDVNTCTFDRFDDALIFHRIIP